jgi:hypothetical protein
MQELNRSEMEASKGEVVGLAPAFQKYVDGIFTYHAPKGTQADRYVSLRETAKTLAYQIGLSCPESRERSVAITKLQECVMFANASIAINE